MLPAFDPDTIVPDSASWSPLSCLTPPELLPCLTPPVLPDNIIVSPLLHYASPLLHSDYSN
jgi:hypothetical protein